VKLGLKVLFHAADGHQYSLIGTSTILQELLSQIVNNQQDNSRETLSSHLELLPALKQLRELCMMQATIVELLSGSHLFQQKTAETSYSGVDNIEDGWMSNGRKLFGATNLGLLYLKVMGKLGFGDFQRKKYDIDCVVPTVKHGGDGVMVWGLFYVGIFGAFGPS